MKERILRRVFVDGEEPSLRNVRNPHQGDEEQRGSWDG
jgi:hypothetical protein